MDAKIKNLIFDVGNVLLEYRWQEMFMDHGLTAEETLELGEKIFQNDIWEKDMDGGNITAEQAIEKYAEQYPEDKENIAWFIHNAELMVVNRPEIWEKVHILKEKGYGIYILSNYSKELFEMHTKGASFLSILDGGIVSYQLHLLKPDEAIYRALTEKYSLNKEECIFLDDRLENVEASEAFGIHAVQVTSRDMLNEFLDEMIQNSREE